MSMSGFLANRVRSFGGRSPHTLEPRVSWRLVRDRHPSRVCEERNLRAARPSTVPGSSMLPAGMPVSSEIPSR
jgi:hypothetical protein